MHLWHIQQDGELLEAVWGVTRMSHWRQRRYPCCGAGLCIHRPPALPLAAVRALPAGDSEPQLVHTARVAWGGPRMLWRVQCGRQSGVACNEQERRAGRPRWAGGLAHACDHCLSFRLGLLQPGMEQEAWSTWEPQATGALKLKLAASPSPVEPAQILAALAPAAGVAGKSGEWVGLSLGWRHRTTLRQQHRVCTCTW